MYPWEKDGNLRCIDSLGAKIISVPSLAGPRQCLDLDAP